MSSKSQFIPTPKPGAYNVQTLEALRDNTRLMATISAGLPPQAVEFVNGATVEEITENATQLATMLHESRIEMEVRRRVKEELQETGNPAAQALDFAAFHASITANNSQEEN